ncbi:hypothetical protein JVU11DRAFT_9175 [Chiua virens]|nr:hypothetical protein JVU11DRAFT_9175 [Chiua virens]
MKTSVVCLKNMVELRRFSISLPRMEWAAKRARERLQGSEISGRPIDVHYSLLCDDKKQGGSDREKNQQYQREGCLIVTLKDSHQHIDDDEVCRKFQQFGDVKSVMLVGDRTDFHIIVVVAVAVATGSRRLRLTLPFPSLSLSLHLASSFSSLEDEDNENVVVIIIATHPRHPHLALPSPFILPFTSPDDDDDDDVITRWSRPCPHHRHSPSSPSPCLPTRDLTTSSSRRDDDTTPTTYRNCLDITILISHLRSSRR